MVSMLCDMLLVQCYNTSYVKIMQREQVDLVCETLDTMAEVTCTVMCNV